MAQERIMQLSSGTVEITNKLNEYKLPETGGSGNRWLYMLSGVVLIAIATITLFYKNKTLKRECEMKTIKRSIALVLAMILTLAMSVTVFAAPNADQNTFSLTLNKAVKGHLQRLIRFYLVIYQQIKTTLSNVK